MKSCHRLGIFVCIIILVGAGLGEASACELTVRNAYGVSVGRIDSRGAVRSTSGSTEGRIEDGTVRSSSGATIGRVTSGGTIRSSSGMSIGSVDSDGTLRDSNGRSIGRITSDGTIRNSAGATRGRFAGYSSSCRHVAAAYLFFFNGLHES